MLDMKGMPALMLFPPGAPGPLRVASIASAHTWPLKSQGVTETPAERGGEAAFATCRGNGSSHHVLASRPLGGDMATAVSSLLDLSV